jgi:hypothetical protein
MKKYFFNFTNKQIVQQTNYQPTNETMPISDFGFRTSECLCFQNESRSFRIETPISQMCGYSTIFFGTNLIKKKQ